MSRQQNSGMNEQQNLIHNLRELLSDGQITTQEDICSALEAKGHLVNQSKISRLIRRLGAIKSKNEQGQIVYRLPHEPAPPTTASQLANLVIDVIANETLIIVNTSPGSAQLIARILDYNKEKIQIIGTIAGDDAIMVAPKSIKKSMNPLKK
ncbi:arginine repressor [Legionella tunisiensis]|uniref:hypothetical protein n=1 Tax=Legionella tunisiensis TaxID=1034944 RepID=UPI0002FF7DC2|nr:hypothetical protein [Legionella tunisiensis]